MVTRTGIEPMLKAVSYTHLYNLEATNNIYLPGGRRVRVFLGIEPLVHPCP